MKHHFLSIMAALVLSSCTTNKTNTAEIVSLDFGSIIVEDNQLALLFKADSVTHAEKDIVIENIYTNTNDSMTHEGVTEYRDSVVVSKNGHFEWISGYGLTKRYHVGDTIFHKGDTLSTWIPDYRTKLRFDDEGVSVITPYKLVRCVIDLDYEEDCIKDKIHMRRFDRMKLELQDKMDGLYIYKAPYTVLQSGHTGLLDKVEIVYQTSESNVWDSQVWFNKEQANVYLTELFNHLK